MVTIWKKTAFDFPLYSTFTMECWWLYALIFSPLQLRAISLFINERYKFNEMFQQYSLTLAIFYVLEIPCIFIVFRYMVFYYYFYLMNARIHVKQYSRAFIRQKCKIGYNEKQNKKIPRVFSYTWNKANFEEFISYFWRVIWYLYLAKLPGIILCITPSYTTTPT